MKNHLLCLLLILSSFPGLLAQKTDAYTEDVRELIGYNLGSTYEILIDNQLSSIKRLRPDISDRAYEALRKEFFKQKTRDELIDMLAGLYKQHFTRKEIKTALKFYRTEAGQKFARETPVIMQEIAPLAEDWGRRVGERAMRDLGYEELLADAAPADRPFTSTAATGGWRRVTVPEAGFSVEMRDDPQYQDQSTENYVLIHAFSNVDESGAAASVLQAIWFESDLDADEASEGEITDFFDRAIEGGRSNINGRILEEKEVTVDGHRGKEVLIEGNIEGPSFTTRLRIILKGNKTIMLQSLWQNGEVESDVEMRFLESLRLDI